MPEQDANLLKILISQIVEHRDINAILGESLGVLSQAKSIEPV